MLLLANCGLWVSSYFRVIGFSHTLFLGTQVRGGSGIWSRGGRILIDTARHVDVPRWPGWRGWNFTIDPFVKRQEFVDSPSITIWHLMGFRCALIISPSGDGTQVETAAIAVPYWSLAVLTAILPSLTFGRTLRRRRAIAAGLCPICGYDLRASPERCPECGHAIAGTAENTSPIVRGA